MLCPKCKRELFTIDGKTRCTGFPILCDYQIANPIPDFLHSNFVVFDLETTGTSPTADRIIEIAAVKVLNGKIEDEFEMLVNPNKIIKSNITNITGITNRMLVDKPNENQAIHMFMDWLGKDYDFVVGHNAKNFDCKFINAACARNGITERLKVVVDTLLVARKMFPIKKGQTNIIPNHKQETLAKYYGIVYDAHRAMEDVKALYKIYMNLMQQASEDYRQYI